MTISISHTGDLSRLPFQKQLSDYETTKGSIHFPLDKPIDYDLIAEITKYRVTVATKTKK